MNIHEYQAKALLRAAGAPVAAGLLAMTPQEAHKAASSLKGPPFIVKAQIHAGGRGKAGGVKRAETLDAVEAIAGEMLGMTLITPQTGPKGRIVRRLYVEEAADIARELYLSLLVERDTGRVAFIASEAGGMDIEAVAAKTPEAITTIPIDPVAGVRTYHAVRLARALGCKDVKSVGALARALYGAFVAHDMSLLEINPLVETGEGALLCLDAKVGLDDNALFRHKALADLRDPDEEDPAEREAQKHDLSYIKLDGRIGCMVNGAGLAMATMDIIKQHGAAPANFLDVGGGASREKVAQAFKILLSDKQVEAVLVNIFGGIMRCDIIAEGIIAAARDMSLNVPVVVRLAGTNVDEGKKRLNESGLRVIAADDLEEAAAKVVAEAR